MRETRPKWPSGYTHCLWTGRSQVQALLCGDFPSDQTLTQGLKILGKKLHDNHLVFLCLGAYHMGLA